MVGTGRSSLCREGRVLGLELVGAEIAEGGVTSFALWNISM